MEVLELFFTLTWILLNTVKIQFSPRITFASSAISGHSGWVKGFSRSKRKVESVWQMQTTANTTEFVEALKAKVEANTRCWSGWVGPGGPTIYENGMKPKTIRKWKYRQCENCLLNVRTLSSLHWRSVVLTNTKILDVKATVVKRRTSSNPKWKVWFYL